MTPFSNYDFRIEDRGQQPPQVIAGANSLYAARYAAAMIASQRQTPTVVYDDEWTPCGSYQGEAWEVPAILDDDRCERIKHAADYLAKIADQAHKLLGQSISLSAMGEKFAAGQVSDARAGLLRRAASVNPLAKDCRVIAAETCWNLYDDEYTIAYGRHINQAEAEATEEDADEREPVALFAD